MTQPTQPKASTVEDWEQRFDTKFPLDGEVWVLERHRDAVKQHQLEEIALAKQQERERIRQMVEKEPTAIHWSRNKKGDFECTHIRCIKKDDVLEKLEE